MKKTFCFNNCACYCPRKNQSTCDLNFQSYLSRKKGTSETFLSLGLFISRSRPTASTSKIRPRLRKTFPQFPFFYFGNFGQISNQTWTNFSSDVVSTKIETKYYILLSLVFKLFVYSPLPNSSAGPNKHVQWKVCRIEINMQSLINVQGGFSIP